MKSTAALLACVITVAAAAQSDPAVRLADEIGRTRAALEANTSAEERAAPMARLERAEAALRAGRVYLATYLAEMPWEAAKNFTLVKSSADVTTTEAFVRMWMAMGEPRPIPAARGARVPALIDALAAVAEARGAATYQASRPYGEDSGLFGGLYYLADSHSAMQFAAMARAVTWPSAAPAPPFRSLSSEIAALDAAMITAYETMEPANHPTYISASAALKQARTLNERGQFSGALFEYLLSRYMFAPLRGAAAAEATPARVAAARAALPANNDHSIAELFLQLADEGLAGSVEARRRGAAAVLDDVVPAYRSSIEVPSATAAGGGQATVTITLVRWPFT